MSAFKAQAMARNLVQRLKAQVAPTLTVTQTLDANSMPIIKLEKGSESIFIKIEVEANASGGVNAVGVSQEKYSPHSVTLLRDAVAADADLREKATSEALKLGSKLSLYEVAAMPSSYDLTGASLIAVIPSDPYNALTLSE
jgi:hypothetical protein